jgi:hypothetical protein
MKPKPETMKKLYLLLIFAAITSQFFAQAPQEFNYQGVARNAAGEPLKETQLNVRIGIMASEQLVYQEDHTVTTDLTGLFSLKIGDPTATYSGGSLKDFSTIQWGSESYSLNVQINNGTGYTDMGSSELLSVPYALYAERINNTRLEVQGDDLLSDEPLFEVRRQDGRPVFVVYNDGVRVYVDSAATKSSKGGFAVGGYSSTKNIEGQEFLRVTPDSVRVYVPDKPKVKGVKGGFAVGGYSDTKGPTDYLMNVDRQSTQFFTGNPREGFTLGDLDSDDKPNYMKLTPYNYLIGLQAGASLDPGRINATSGRYNTHIGYQAGMTDVDGRYNLFIGNSAGKNNTGSATALDGNFNVFLGHSTGFSNTTGYQNVFLGSNSGNSNTSGYENVFVGIRAGASNTSGYQNVFLGETSGQNNTSGYSNIFIGQKAGFNNKTGNNNIFIGRLSGYTGIDHENNIFIGDSTGYFTNYQFATKNVFIGYAAGKNTQSYNNIFIGNRAGYKNTEGQNNIAIGDEAGKNNISSQNIFIGTQAGRDNTDGYFNIIMGRWAGRNNTTGYHQILIGGGAGGSMTTGNENVIIGGNAGAVNSTGSGNIFLGYSAGWSNTGSGNIIIGNRVGYNSYQNVSNALIIDNETTTSPLIYGDFENDYLRFNANVGIGTYYNTTYGLRVDGGTSTSYSMYVYKGAYTPGSFYSASDARMKTGISIIEDALGIINQIHGVRFNWKRDEYPDRKFSEQTQIGVIAQDVEKVLPEVVSEDQEGYKAIAYDKLTAVLIEAIKEQQEQIDALKSENARLSAIESRLKAIEEQMTGR